MARQVGRQGYAATSIAAVVVEAGSSQAGFDRHFADKEEGFVAAHEMLAARAMGAVRERMEAEGEWLERVIEGLRRMVELCSEQPELARALLVEPAAAGAEAQRRALKTLELFAELIAPDGELAELLPPRAALMAASGVVGLIGEELRRGEEAELAALAPDLSFALLVPLLGPVAAGQELERILVGATG